MMKFPRPLMTATWMLAVMICPSCTTVTPDSVKDDEASYDSSTPVGYSAYNSGFGWYTRNAQGEVDGGIITDNSLKKYNMLVSAYAIQFKARYKVEINPGDGVDKVQEKAVEGWHWIDAQHLVYFRRLSKWAKNKVPNDTVWAKLIDKVD